VADEDDGFAFVGHVAQDVGQFARFLGGENGRWLIQNQNIRPPVEQLQNLYPLLLPHRKLPDRRSWVYRHPILLAQRLNIRFQAAHIGLKRECPSSLK
jgi:hypothetical protein